MTSNWRYNLGPIGMGGGEILFAILPRDDSLRDTVKDLEAIATKTFPDMAIEGSLLKVAYFIAGYQLMWSELGNLHPRHQFGKYVGREPLFTDSYCRVINKKVTPKDYLLVFRDFLEKWAYHLHTGDEKRGASDAAWGTVDDRRNVSGARTG